MSGHLWSMATNSESQRVCRRCCDEAAGSPNEYQHSRVDGAARCCFRLLFASLSTWLACQRLAQRLRLTTPRLLPRPSRRNNCIGPEGATTFAGPLATLTKLRCLELRYGPLAVGRAEGESGWARCQGGRKYYPLRHVRPSTLPCADSLFPHSLPPARYDSRRPSPPQAQRPRPRQRVGTGGVARAAGRPVVPEPCRPWRRRSRGWAACRTWTSASPGIARRAGIFIIIVIIEIIVLFVIIYIIAIIVLIGVVFEGTRWSRSHLGWQTCCNC